MKVAWLALVLLATVAACKSLPEAGVGVASIRFRGNHEFRSGQLEERIATQETPKFLGLFRASWRRYQDFAPEVLEKDLERLRHFYERHGYYDTQIRAGRVVESGKFVEVEILVQEGPPVLVHSIAVRGLEAKPTLLTVRVSDGLTLDKGDVFDQEKFDASTKFAAEILADHGYAYADVTPRAVVDLGPRTADLAFQIDPGIECKFGPITFEGLDDLPEKLIRRTFGVESGEPYEADDLDLGRRALVELGVFASVDVTPDLS
ncbi:MAG TPA: POTRA domain-containing protein, partial [Polyangiaceae bacterium]|nr:POTRA domain-containing protein [Polyangiaceae bacterium]